MKYYWISYELAVSIHVTAFRRGNRDGYIVNTGDLSSVDVVSEKESGRLQEMTEDEAIVYIRQHQI